MLLSSEPYTTSSIREKIRDLQLLMKGTERAGT